jgi:hypothetical protein
MVTAIANKNFAGIQVHPPAFCYNAEMSEDPPEDRPPDASVNRSRERLQCIGSFNAYTQDGELYSIEIWTHFGAVHDRERARVSPGLLFLKTTEGHEVDRVDQGEYRLRESPEITFSTDDPNAP